MREEILLQLEDISVSYGGVKALDKANIYVKREEVVALVGPNGAGKSTVLKVIFGLAPIYSGKIFWRGKRIKPVSHEMAERGIAFVPQGRRVFTNLTVEENLEIGGFVIKDKNKIGKRIEEVMEIFPLLKERRDIKASAFSGGEQQMIALARGFMVNPKVLLLDEPSLGLAPKIAKQVFAKIKELNEKYKTTIIVVEHNIKSVLGISRRAYILNKGRIVAEDNSQNLLNSDVLKKVFMSKRIEK